MSKTCPHCFGKGTVPDQKKIGKQLRDKRDGAGIGLREMARRIQVCPAFLSRLERGMANWTPKLVVRFEAGLES